MDNKAPKPVLDKFARAPNLARMRQQLWDGRGEAVLANSPAIKEINSINLQRKMK